MNQYDAWKEYDAAAEWCAKRGIKGNIGDPLPENMGKPACDLIDEDPESFAMRVREFAYALAMDARKLNGSETY